MRMTSFNLHFVESCSIHLVLCLYENILNVNLFKMNANFSLTIICMLCIMGIEKLMQKDEIKSEREKVEKLMVIGKCHNAIMKLFAHI